MADLYGYVGKSHATFRNTGKLTSGPKLDVVRFGSRALAIASNPEYPYFAVGFDSGVVQLFSLYDGKTISLLTTFVLTRNSISNVSFAEAGKLLIAVDMEVGEFFIIEVSKDLGFLFERRCLKSKELYEKI